LSSLNSFTVEAWSALASPPDEPMELTVDNLGLPEAGVLELGDGDGDGELEADVLGDGVEPAPILLAPTAWPEPADFDEEGDALGLVVGVAEGDDVGVAEGVAEADGLGVVVVEPVVVFGPVNRTCRSRSNAVSPTSVATFCAPAPGTDTTISFVPCWTTDAPERPVASTRSVMIWIALVIEPWSTGFPFGDTALSVIDVPLERSSPRPTLKLLCQSAGRARLPPITLTTITRSSTTRAVRYRPG